jgi:hypothetical protein
MGQECPVRVPQPITTDSLTAELKVLRRGLGLYHPDLDRRLGPGLREICAAGTGEPDLRGKVIGKLQGAAGALPAELSVAVLAALGIHPDTRHLDKLEDRADWLAHRLNRDARTARRRIDQGCAMLAENLAAGRADRRGLAASTGWYIESAQSVMLLDTGVPTAIDRRVVVAERDGIDHLVLSRSVPPTASGRPEVSGQVLFGGLLGLREWESASRFRLVLDLPRTLRAGDRHEYSVLWRQPADVPMRPYYIFVPVLRVDHFDLHVRFDHTAPPDRVWQIADAFHRDLDEEPRDSDEIEVDRCGEAHVEFENLAPGHTYGVRWK